MPYTGLTEHSLSSRTHSLPHPLFLLCPPARSDGPSVSTTTPPDAIAVLLLIPQQPLPFQGLFFPGECDCPPHIHPWNLSKFPDVPQPQEKVGRKIRAQAPESGHSLPDQSYWGSSTQGHSINTSPLLLHSIAYRPLMTNSGQQAKCSCWNFWCDAEDKKSCM